MIVAQLRGVEFKEVDDEEGHWWPVDSFTEFVNSVFDDVYGTLGFRQRDDYLDALERERERIFDRLSGGD